jgi:uncharacterized iron-regulated membrane protein
MNPFELPANNAASDWLIFLAILVPVCLAIAGFIVWVRFRNQGKKSRRRRHRHHRHTNPTLAETGGLPPLRDPNEPPPGP